MKGFDIRITDLCPADAEAICQTADLLVKSFHEYWPKSWPNIEAALREVQQSFGADRISRVAIDESGAVLG